MKIYSFENLDVWKSSKKLTVEICKLTNAFPDAERFGLVSQMRRAAISVCSNIAERNSKFTPKEKAKFTSISYCSLMELLNQSIISVELKFLKQDQLETLRALIDPIALMLSKLRNAQMKL